MIFLDPKLILKQLEQLFERTTCNSKNHAQIQNEIDDFYVKVIKNQNIEFIFFWKYIFAKLFNYYLKCFISDKIKDDEFKKKIKKYKELQKKNTIKQALRKNIGSIFNQDSTLLESCCFLTTLEKTWPKSTTYCQYCYNLLSEKLIKNQIKEKSTSELDDMASNGLLPDNYHSHLTRINHLLKQFYSNRDFNPDKDSSNHLLMKKYLVCNIIIQMAHDLFEQKKINEKIKNRKINSEKLPDYLRAKIARWQNILFPKQLTVLLAYYLKHSSNMLKPKIKKIIFAYNFRKQIDSFIDKIDAKIK